MDVADILDRAADLIEPEGRWMQRHAGRDAKGRIVDPDRIDAAVCFCAVGAIWKAVGGMTDANKRFVIDECFPPVHRAIRRERGIGTWNDHPKRTQAQVVAKLREAAALARKAPPHA